jgi:hypothetical protein
VSWWCDFPGCKQRGEWRLDGTDLTFCEGHAAAAAVSDDPIDEARRAVREEIADEQRGERFDEIARRSW